jgi:hypothetical protein
LYDLGSNIGTYFAFFIVLIKPYFEKGGGMRKAVAIMLIIFSSWACIYGQDKTIGIKGGFTIANFWGDGADNLNGRLRTEIPNLDEQNLYWFTVGLFNTRNVLPDLFSFRQK